MRRDIGQVACKIRKATTKRHERVKLTCVNDSCRVVVVGGTKSLVVQL